MRGTDGLTLAVAVALAALGSGVLVGRATTTPPLATPLPEVEIVLWAWERPEDLRFVDPDRVSVAPLVGTVRLHAGGLDVRPRSNALRLPAGVDVLPVVRVEVDRRSPPRLDGALADRAAAAVVGLARGAAVQVDFDAALSQRQFQRQLVERIRRRLPEGAFLSATALASSCLDGGAALLAVDEHLDEVVPMLFRLGPEAAPLRRRLARGLPLPPPCDRALGLATDEPASTVPPSHVRLYLFAPRAWDGALLREALAEVHR